MLLLAVAAGDVIASAGDLDVDMGHQRASPVSSRWSIWPIAPATRRRSESCACLRRSNSSAGGAAARARLRGRGLDPRKRLFDPAEGFEGARVGHGGRRHSMASGRHRHG